MPEKEMPVSHHQRFPSISIDISQQGKNISDTSEATEYLNQFARQKLNFSNQEAFKVSQDERLAKGHKLYRFQHFYQDIQVEFNDLILFNKSGWQCRSRLGICPAYRGYRYGS